MVGGQLSDVQEGAVLVWLGSATLREDGDFQMGNPPGSPRATRTAPTSARVWPARATGRDGDDEILAGAPEFDEPLAADEGRAALWNGSTTWSIRTAVRNAAWSLELHQAAPTRRDGGGRGRRRRRLLRRFLVGAPDYDNTGISGPGEAG